MKRLLISLVVVAWLQTGVARADDYVPEGFNDNIAEFTANGWQPEGLRGGTADYLSRTPEAANLAGDEPNWEDYGGARTGFKIHVGCEKQDVPKILKVIADRNNKLTSEIDRLRSEGGVDNEDKADKLSKQLLRYKVRNPNDLDGYDPKMIVVYLRPQVDASEVGARLADAVPARRDALSSGDARLVVNKPVGLTFGINETVAGEDGKPQQLMRITDEERSQILTMTGQRGQEGLTLVKEALVERDGQHLVNDDKLRREHGLMLPTRHATAVTEFFNTTEILKAGKESFGTADNADGDDNATATTADTSLGQARTSEDSRDDQSAELVTEASEAEEGEAGEAAGDPNDLPDIPDYWDDKPAY